MMVFLGVVCVVVFALLVLVASVTPRRSTISRGELERRAKRDKTAVALLRRERLLGDVLSLQRVSTALLLSLLILLSVAAFGWLVGVTIAVVVALEYGAVARIEPIRLFAGRIYERYESSLLDIVESFSGFMWFIRGTLTQPVQTGRIDSREELRQVVAQSGDLLSGDEKKLITHSLEFESHKVHEIMTPREAIDSITMTELLGPLVLDDLHKTGHSRFPVVDGDVDHVVGMLYIQNLLTLDTKRSTTAQKAMDPRVFYIRDDQTLQHALAAFLRTHHQLFVVVNKNHQTVGLLSLQDVIEALLGRKIIDEFDSHDDLRAVVRRNLRSFRDQP